MPGALRLAKYRNLAATIIRARRAAEPRYANCYEDAMDCRTAEIAPDEMRPLLAIRRRRGLRPGAYTAGGSCSEWAADAN